MIRPTVDGRCDNAHRNRMDAAGVFALGRKPRVRNVDEMAWLLLSLNPPPRPPLLWWQWIGVWMGWWLR